MLAQQRLDRNLVGKPTCTTYCRQVLNECWPAPAMEVEGILVKDIFELVSLVLSWTFKILAHEEYQYTDFLSIALEQTKARPRSSGTQGPRYLPNIC